MRIRVSSLLLALALAFAVPSQAQAAHNAVITWNASTDAAANPTLAYNIYKLSGSCPATAPTTVGTGGFAKVNSSPIAGLTFTDTPLPIGPVCYYGTSILNGAESVPGSLGGGIVSPSTITIRIQVS